MPAEVYTFSAVGQDGVLSAYKSIAQAAQQAQRAEVAAARPARSVGSSAPRATANPAAKLALKVAADQEKAAKKLAQTEARSAEQAAQAQIKAREHVNQIRMRYDAAEARSAAKTADEQARARQHVANIRARYDAAEERGSAKLRASQLKTVGRIGDKALSAGLGVAASGFGVASGLVGVAARDSIRHQDAAVRLSIAGRESGKAAVDPTILRKEAEAVAMATPGISAQDVTEASQGFVAKTGRLDLARQNAGTFAAVASASGSDVKDVANAAADLFQKFDITSLEGMKDALAALTEQGKNGAFELKDAASQMSKMAAAASRFGLDKGAKGVATLGGLTQIARSATGSPEEAATAVEAMFRQLVAKSKDLKGVGVEVFKDAGQTRTNDVQDILVNTIAKTKGNLPELQKIFDVKGIAAVSPLISTFNEAANGAHGAKGGPASEAEKTAAGVAALRAALSTAINTTEGWAGVQKDAAAAQAMNSSQLSAAWEALVTEVGGQLTPALLDLAHQFSAAATKTDAIENLVVVFVALAEAAGLAVDALKYIGLIHEKEVTKPEALKNAKKELADFEKSTEGHLSTTAEGKKRRELKAKVELAEEAMTQKAKPPETPEEFAKHYAELAGENGRKLDPTEARSFAADIKGGLGQNDWLQKLNGENEAQRDLRRQFQGDIQYQQQPGPQGQAATPAPAPVADKGTAEAAAALKDAAAALKDAAAAGKAQPSIIGGT